MSGPLAINSPAALRAWIGDAAKGEAISYWQGTSLKGLRRDVRAGLDAHVAIGTITLVQARLAGGVTEYRAVRTGRGIDPVPGFFSAGAVDLTRAEAFVLRAIRQAAAGGLPLPKLAMLAADSADGGAQRLTIDQVRRAIAALEGKGLVTITRHWGSFSRCWRVAQLMDTGAATAPVPAGFGEGSPNYEGALPGFGMKGDQP